jgi:gas vesicle protein
MFCLTAPVLFGAACLLGRAGFHDASNALLRPPLDRIDRAEFYYWRLVNSVQLNDKAGALRELKALDNLFEQPATVRQRALVYYIRNELAQWRDDLGDIGRDAKNVAGRLARAQAGPRTQEVQAEIVRKLDKRIKQLEDERAEAQAQAAPSEVRPAQPQRESAPAPGGGPGRVDEKRLKELAEQWGRLPEKERAKAMQDMAQTLPPRYREIIENYARSLARGK